MSKIIDKIKTVLRINKNVIKAEVQEVKELVITEEDKAQGKAAATLAVAALAACGVPLGALGQPVLEKVMPYIIRDAKDGVKSPDKLIIGRIVSEVKAERAKGNLKTLDEIKQDILNK